MVKKTTRATTTTPKAKKASAKKPAAASSRKKATVSKSARHTVDYYPNRMTFAISALAGTLLVLLAMIAVINLQG